MLDVRSTFKPNVDGLALLSSQEIDHDYLAKAQADKDASLDPMKGEMHRVCTVPAVLVEKWLREGFNVYKEPAKAIVARLQREHLDAFVTTKRRL